jgi:hypothetical protein
LFTRPETSQYLKMIKAKPAVPHPRRVRNGNQVECVYWPVDIDFNVIERPMATWPVSPGSQGKKRKRIYSISTDHKSFISLTLSHLRGQVPLKVVQGGRDSMNVMIGTAAGD